MNVDDDGQVGTVTIGAKERSVVDEARRRIEMILDPPSADVGAVYTGKVVNITKFGAFVNILPGRDGLIHISRLGQGKQGRARRGRRRARPGDRGPRGRHRPAGQGVAVARGEPPPPRPRSPREDTDGDVPVAAAASAAEPGRGPSGRRARAAARRRASVRGRLRDRARVDLRRPRSGATSPAAPRSGPRRSSEGGGRRGPAAARARPAAVPGAVGAELTRHTRPGVDRRPVITTTTLDERHQARHRVDAGGRLAVRRGLGRDGLARRDARAGGDLAFPRAPAFQGNARAHGPRDRRGGRRRRRRHERLHDQGVHDLLRARPRRARRARARHPLRHPLPAGACGPKRSTPSARSSSKRS